MRKLKLYAVLLVMVFIITGCDLIDPVPVKEDLSYLGSLNRLTSDEEGANLSISTLTVDIDYVLCVDGEVVGVIDHSSKIEVNIDIEDNELTSLWLIPTENIETEDDINIQNSSYTWITKLYTDNTVRVWNPGENSTNDSTRVTFLPSGMGSYNWDYVVGYLNNNETYTPVTILTPNDTDGEIVNIDFGLTKITWKFYNSSQNDNQGPVLIKEIEQEIVLTSDERNKDIYIPILQEENQKLFNLNLKNMESTTIIVKLNGIKIEDVLINPISGSSYIEGYKSRDYRDAKNEQNNALEIINNKGQIYSLSFSAEDGENIYITYTESDGLTLN